MMQQHPITPPPELVQQWDDEGTAMFRPEYQQHLTTRAAEWGADAELEACLEWLEVSELNVDTYKLRADRRPERINRPEANSKPTPNPSQIRSSLVERVSAAICTMADCGDTPSNWAPEARAAIREVALWLSENSGGTRAVWMLEREAER